MFVSAPRWLDVMRPKVPRTPAMSLISLMFCGVLGGCDHHGSTVATAANHDRPVPASEPRAEMVLELDLPPASDCEERFDLALYPDRRIDLVAWDEGEGCVRRGVRIRYLSAKLSPTELLTAVKELARDVRQLAGERDTSGATSTPPRGEGHRNEETK